MFTYNEQGTTACPNGGGIHDYNTLGVFQFVLIS